MLVFTVEELRHAHRIVGAAEAPICLAAVTIIVPQGNSMRALGAELVEHGVDFQAAREEAERRRAGWNWYPLFTVTSFAV